MFGDTPTRLWPYSNSFVEEERIELPACLAQYAFTARPDLPNIRLSSKVPFSTYIEGWLPVIVSYDSW
jgi:hypothetical protein